MTSSSVIISPSAPVSPAIVTPALTTSHQEEMQKIAQETFSHLKAALGKKKYWQMAEGNILQYPKILSGISTQLTHLNYRFVSKMLDNIDHVFLFEKRDPSPGLFVVKINCFSSMKMLGIDQVMGTNNKVGELCAKKRLPDERFVKLNFWFFVSWSSELKRYIIDRKKGLQERLAYVQIAPCVVDPNQQRVPDGFEYVAQNSPLKHEKVRDVVERVIQIAQILEYAHSKNCAMRDFTIENLMFCSDRTVSIDHELVHYYPDKNQKIVDFPPRGALMYLPKEKIRSYYLYHEFNSEDTVSHNPFLADRWHLGVMIYRLFLQSDLITPQILHTLRSFDTTVGMTKLPEIFHSKVQNAVNAFEKRLHQNNALQGISRAVAAVVKKVLQSDPEARMAPEAVASHFQKIRLQFIYQSQPLSEHSLFNEEPTESFGPI